MQALKVENVIDLSLQTNRIPTSKHLKNYSPKPTPPNAPLKVAQQRYIQRLMMCMQ